MWIRRGIRCDDCDLEKYIGIEFFLFFGFIGFLSSVLFFVVFVMFFVI
jgi:hypothetical protein